MPRDGLGILWMLLGSTYILSYTREGLVFRHFLCLGGLVIPNPQLVTFSPNPSQGFCDTVVSGEN